MMRIYHAVVGLGGVLLLCQYIQSRRHVQSGCSKYFTATETSEWWRGAHKSF